MKPPPRGGGKFGGSAGGNGWVAVYMRAQSLYKRGKKGAILGLWLPLCLLLDQRSSPHLGVCKLGELLLGHGWGRAIVGYVVDGEVHRSSLLEVFLGKGSRRYWYSRPLSARLWCVDLAAWYLDSRHHHDWFLCRGSDGSAMTLRGRTSVQATNPISDLRRSCVLWVHQISAISPRRTVPR